MNKVIKNQWLNYILPLNILILISTNTLAATELSNTIPTSELSGLAASKTYFTFTVPETATNLTFNTLGGSGDADLYVKFGEDPTESNYDCRPHHSGNSESCAITKVQSGDYHVMLKGYSNYSNLTLTANYTVASSLPQRMSNGSILDNSIAIDNLTGNSEEQLAFTFEVPADAQGLTIGMSGGEGDADLYVRHGSMPNPGTYDCRPYTMGNDETCHIQEVQAGTYHILISSYADFSGIKLIGSYTDAGDLPPTPEPGTSSLNIAVAGDSITRAFGASCTTNASWWSLLCLAGGDQPQHSWFNGASSLVNSVHDRYKVLDNTINATNNAATGAELTGIRESGSEPSFAAQAHNIISQTPTPEHVEFILGGNDLCSRNCIDPANCDDPIYTDDEWRQAVQTGLNTLVSGMPQGSSILIGSVPRVQDIRQAGLDKQASNNNINCESIWSTFNVCKIVTQTANLNGEPIASRLAAVAAAQQRYNAILAEEANAYNTNANGQNPNGIELVAEYVDESTPSGGTFQFGPSEINGGDCFHPNIATQSLIADLMWNSNTDKSQ
ncbi:pre-peptidase C-terminal domain-containing protein [Shewanella sp. VB17]|uniref:PPC domain-containing protein n=1 Tax=Shewanella sp. VB17 TaxID=2739432 RepID=UPI001563F037|nr:PPC domain-containing protein [Shewanella sp. VB17]NRD75789.1 pre-peptidase C-terminal domain-containing protein [Shewanella sp. VB17]